MSNSIIQNNRKQRHSLLFAAISHNQCFWLSTDSARSQYNYLRKSERVVHQFHPVPSELKYVSTWTDLSVVVEELHFWEDRGCNGKWTPWNFINFSSIYFLYIDYPLYFILFYFFIISIILFGILCRDLPQKLRVDNLPTSTESTWLLKKRKEKGENIPGKQTVLSSRTFHMMTSVWGRLSQQMVQILSVLWLDRYHR